MAHKKFPLVSFRALTVAATVSAMIVPATESVASTLLYEYTTGQYLDFATNSGLYAAGSTGIDVYYKDGTASGYTIPLMPNLSGFSAYYYDTLTNNGGSGLVGAQYILTAAHCWAPTDETSVKFYHGQGSKTVTYGVNDYEVFASTGNFKNQNDVMMIRLDKIVTEATYNPYSQDSEFLAALAQNQTWCYRLGMGACYQLNSEGKSVAVPDYYQYPFGGVMSASSVKTNEDGSVIVILRYSDVPLNNMPESGDSGSLMYAFNESTGTFETVGAASESTGGTYGAGSHVYYVYNTNVSNFVAGCDSTTISVTDGGEKILWNSTEATFTNESGETLATYYDSSYGNEAKGIVFSNAGTSAQEIQLQGDINMGYGSLTFNEGEFVLSASTEDAVNFNSAGFIINEGASVTTTFTGASGTEWRKVGEGTLTIQGSGDHDIALNVGGGVQRYEVIKDDEGNITGYKQILKGEVRLDREDGYAAKTIKLSAGIASVVLMRDGQINGASSFTFGVGGGLLNMNGQDLEWDVLNHTDSGAKIGNVQLFDATGTQADSTFTYTGTGTFLGSFTDGEGAGNGTGTGLLKVVYNNADSGTWTLSGVSDNAGGFTVQSGTMALEGKYTSHITGTDTGDYTYAILESAGGVTVESGATFRLGHHALMTGDVTVNGGTFEMNQTVNAASESIGGSQRQDVSDFVSLNGNVALTTSDSTMRVATDSSVAVNYNGNITGEGNFEKTGLGTLKLSGTNTFTGTKTISGGVVEFASVAALGGNATEEKWLVEKDGALGITGVGADALQYVSEESVGVLALGADVATQIGLQEDGSLSHDGLFVGAMSGMTVEYGSSDLTLQANSEKQWLLGGGGGTLNVNFLLTGENSLIIGNENSSGTVYLANTNNDFSGDIVIGGFNNFLTYADLAALGNAKIAVSYGNALNVLDGDPTGTIALVSSDSSGVLAISEGNSSIALNTFGSNALGAIGEVRYTGTLTAHDTNGYAFGGTGTLILDTNLTGGSAMTIDAQGMSGGAVIFAQENDYTGAVTVGGKLNSASEASVGSISVGFETKNALANAASVTLKEGAILELGYGDGFVNNLTAETGASIVNNGADTRTLTISNSSDTTLASGTLGGGTNRLNIVKEGTGTLTLGTNTGYLGTFTINEGTVVASSASSASSSFGVSDTGNKIVIGDNGTLKVSFDNDNDNKNRAVFTTTQFYQPVTGTGTIVASSGGSILLLDQSEQFKGRVEITGETRLFVGSGFTDDLLTKHSNLAAFNGATIAVADGSQVRVTNRISNHSWYRTDAVQNSYANYEIAGSGISRWSNTDRVLANANGGGALSVDCASVIHGTVTLVADASVASWSQNYGAESTTSYGIGQWVGGTIRGAILGDHALTVVGNQGLTFKADAASNYGSLTLASLWNGNSTYCPWSLRVGLGEAKDTVSTALGNGTVTIKAGSSNNILTLRFDNAGTDDAGITYTYNNDFSVVTGKLESAYNTTKITGEVNVAGGTLNLETRNSSVLRLEGGISGSDQTVGITDGSKIVFGGNATGFGGTINAGEGSTLGLLASVADNAAFGSDVTLNFTGTLTLDLNGAGTFTFGDIIGTASATAAADDTETSATGTTLNLSYDFTTGTSGSQLSATSITADNVLVSLELNGTDDLEKGTYTLFSGDTGDTAFTLVSSDLNGRVSLSSDDSAVYLVVDADSRLFWAHDSTNTVWDESTSHWTNDDPTKTVFASGDSVVFGSAGVASDNSATSRETVTINDTLTANSIVVKDGTFYSFEGEGALTVTEKLNVYGASLELKNTGTNTFAAVTIGGDSAEEAGELIASAAGTLTNSTVALNENGTLTLGADGALAGTSTVTFNGGTLKYGAAVTSDISSMFVAGTGGLNLDINGQSGIVLGALDSGFALKAINIQNTAGTAADVTLGSSSAAFAVSAGSSVFVAENATLTHYASGTLSTLSGTGTYALYGSLTVADTTDFNGNLDGTGTLTKSGTGTLTLAGTATLGTLVVSSGTADISGTGNFGVLKASTTSGNIIISGGTTTVTDQIMTYAGGVVTQTGGTVNTNRLVMHQNGNGSGTSTYNLEGGVLNVTGTTTGVGTSASVLLGHWRNGKGLLNVTGGVLNAANTVAVIGWDSESELNISGGEVNVLGLNLNDGKSASAVLALSGDGRLNVGSSGLVATTSYDTVTFSGGTVGALDSWSSTAEIALSNTVTFDTEKRSVSASGASTATGEGATITLSGTLSGSSAVLEKTGTGTLDLSGTATLGKITVGGGTLDASGTVSASTLTVNGGEAALSGTFTGTDSMVVNAGSLNVTGTATAPTLTMNGGATTISGVLSGAETVTVNAGTLTLASSGEMTSTGITEVVANAGGTANFEGKISSAYSSFVADGGTMTFSGEMASSKALFSVSNGGTMTISSDLSSTETLFGVGSNSTLVLSGAVSVSDFTTALMTNYGTIEVTDSATFNLLGEETVLEEGVTVQLVSVGDGSTISGVEKTKFTWNGSALVERTNFSFDETTGVVTLSGNLTAFDLTWNGGTSGTWNRSTANFTTDAGATSETFYNGDNVTLATSGANITIGEAISAGTVTVAEDATLTATSANTFAANTVVIAEGKTLTLSGQENFSWTTASVEAGATLDLGTGSNQQVSKAVTGTGTVKLVNTSGDHGIAVNLGTDFSGTLDVKGNLNWVNLTVGDDATLRLSRTSGTGHGLWGDSAGTLNNRIELGSDYRIRLETAALTLNGEIVGNGYTLNVNSSNSASNAATFNGTVTLGGLIVGMEGTGIDYSGAVSFNGSTTIDTVKKFDTGTLAFTGNTNIGTMTISEGALSFTESSTTLNKSVGTLTLGNGVAFSVQQNASPAAATVVTDKLNLSGAATVRIGNAEAGSDGKWGNSHQGYLKFKDLGLSGVSSGTLNLVSNHNSSLRTIFEIGDADTTSEGSFAGTINLSVENTKNRSASLVISNATVAKNAEINLASNAGSSGVLLLGVNAETVTIGGLSSELGTTKAKVYSGKIGAQTSQSDTAYADSNTSSGTKRTLEIATAEGTSYSYNGEIRANVALVKSGAGTQTLAGANAYFDGGTTVIGGTLVATNATALGTGAVTVKSGAVLQADAAITFNTAAQTLTLAVGSSQLGETGEALVTSSTGGSVSVTDAALVYIDVSALANARSTLGESISLKLAAETALAFNDENANVGWWDDSGSWAQWSVVNAYSYDSTSGVLTLTIPEPSSFGLLAGLSALALCVARRRRTKKA